VYGHSERASYARSVRSELECVTRLQRAVQMSKVLSSAGVGVATTDVDCCSTAYDFLDGFSFGEDICFDSGPRGDQFSGGKAIRQNRGQGSTNLIPTLVLPSSNPPISATRQLRSSSDFTLRILSIVPTSTDSPRLAITAITINHDSHGQHDALATSTIVRLLRF